MLAYSFKTETRRVGKLIRGLVHLNKKRARMFGHSILCQPLLGMILCCVIYS